MKNFRICTIVFLIVGLLVLSNLLPSPNFATADETQPEITVTKKVWTPGGWNINDIEPPFPRNYDIRWEFLDGDPDEEPGVWANGTYANIGDILTFNITITYHKNCDSGTQARDIKVVDTLPPCLAYDNNVTIIHGDDVYDDAGESGISGNLIFWNLTEDYGIRLYHHSTQGPRSVSILFNATVVGYTDADGEDNQVDVFAYETCCGWNVEGHGEATVIVPSPFESSISIEKTADPKVIHAGDTVTYTYTVNNTGDCNLSDVFVDDSILGEISNIVDKGNNDDILEPDETWVYNATSVLYEDTTNVGNVTARDDLGRQVFDKNDSFVDVIHPDIKVVKTVDPKVIYSDGQVTWNITVENTGDVILTSVFVIDDNLGVIYSDETLAPGEKLYREYNTNPTSYTTNCAVVNGTDPLGLEVVNSSCASVEVLCLDIGIEVNKTVKWNCGGDFAEEVYAHVGDWVVFKIEVNNTGDTPLDIVVVDELPPGLSYADNANPVPDDVSGNIITWYFDDVESGASIVITFYADVDECEEQINLVNVTGTFENQVVDSEDIATVNVDCLPPPVANVSVEKYVKLDCQCPFVKYVEAEIGDYVVFKLFVNNTGDTLLDISVRDELPDGLTYNDSASPKEPDHIDGNNYYWNFTDVQPGTSIEITFKADVDECEEQINLVNVTGITEQEEAVYDENTVIVDVTCDTESPIVEITKPKENWLYRNNIRIRPLLVGKTKIIGYIRIKVKAEDASGIEKVEFYIDGQLEYTDTSSKYSWIWLPRSKEDHTIKVIAYDIAGNDNSAELTVSIGRGHPLLTIGAIGGSVLLINRLAKLRSEEEAEPPVEEPEEEPVEEPEEEPEAELGEEPEEEDYIFWYIVGALSVILAMLLVGLFIGRKFYV